MKDIAIYGAGGFGREVACMIERINSKQLNWNILGFLDDGIAPGTKVGKLNVLGGLDYVNNYKQELSVVVAIGNVKHLKSIAQYIDNDRIKFPNIIDETALIDPSVKMGKGNIITYSNFLSCDVVIGDFNIFNTRCGIGHDSTIGSYNVFNPNVQISGGVNICDENFWGLNSSILQYKNVGNRNTIGACSLLLRNVKDDSLYFGVPAIKQEKY
jgi:sugar O-acyltransferase (sialic acid O-acetyltransferase NeuD family)